MKFKQITSNPEKCEKYPAGHAEFCGTAVVVRDERMVAGKAMDESMRAALVAALPKLRRFCHAMTTSAADGDDLMQTTVERAINRADQFQPGTRLDSWLFRIAQNIHIDGLRAGKRRGLAIPIEDAPEMIGQDGRDLVENRSQLAAAQRALQTVPEDQRAAFVLVVIEGLSYREAAEALEVPVGTIMSRIARARVRIEAAVNAGAETLGAGAIQ